MTWKKAPEELIDLFYANMENFPTGELRKMFGYPCSFINNNMFTGLHEENWVVRLSEEDRKEMMQTYGAQPFEPMKGRIMKEYLALPRKVRENKDLLQEWLEKSHSFVSSLPPKPKKEKKKSKGIKSS